MRLWVKVFIAIALLPLCMGLVGALARVLPFSGHASSFWVTALGGAACWFAVYVLLPKPMLLYVLGHELTHAVWTWLFGGRVKRFNVVWL